MVKSSTAPIVPQPSPSLLRKCRIALLAADLPECEAGEKSIELAAMVTSPDMRVAEVSRYRNESSATTQRKLRLNAYESYLSGPGLDNAARHARERRDRPRGLSALRPALRSRRQTRPPAEGSRRPDTGRRRPIFRQRSGGHARASRAVQRAF